VSAKDQDAWMRVGMAHKAAGGTLDTFVKWTADPVQERETRARWSSFKVDGGIGPGTLYKLAHERGWIDPTEQGAAAVAEALRVLDNVDLIGEEEAAALAARALARIRMVPSVAAVAVERVRAKTGVEISPYSADGFPNLGRFQPIPAAEFARAEAGPSLIKGLLRRAGVGMIYGASGSGKTFAALDFGGCVERGEPWRGLKVTRGRVVYICAEGQSGFRKRLAAYMKAHRVELRNFDVIADVPNLLHDCGALADAIGRADLVIVDTLAQTTAGADENSAQDMGRILAELRKLQEASGGLVLLVHHSGKDSERGARGSSSIHAAMDVVLEVVRDGDSREVRVRKQKDGDDDGAFPFVLKVVELGVDEDGDPITSCVVEHVEPPARRRGEPAGDVQKIVYRAAPGTVDEVITRAVEQMPHDPQKRDKRREHARRALQGLLAARWLVQVGDGVYWPDASPPPVAMAGEVLF
jgi:hypothetical protein